MFGSAITRTWNDELRTEAAIVDAALDNPEWSLIREDLSNRFINDDRRDFNNPSSYMLGLRMAADFLASRDAVNLAEVLSAFSAWFFTHANVPERYEENRRIWRLIDEFCLTWSPPVIGFSKPTQSYYWVVYQDKSAHVGISFNMFMWRHAIVTGKGVNIDNEIAQLIADPLIIRGAFTLSFLGCDGLTARIANRIYPTINRTELRRKQFNESS